MNKTAELLAENARLKRRVAELEAQLAALQEVDAPKGAELLQSVGVQGVVARALARKATLDAIKGWVSYAKAQRNLTNPAGLVVSRLKNGEAPPHPKEDRERADRMRYRAWAA